MLRPLSLASSTCSHRFRPRCRLDRSRLPLCRCADGRANLNYPAGSTLTDSTAGAAAGAAVSEQWDLWHQSLLGHSGSGLLRHCHRPTASVPVILPPPLHPALYPTCTSLPWHNSSDFLPQHNPGAIITEGVCFTNCSQLCHQHCHRPPASDPVTLPPTVSERDLDTLLMCITLLH